MNSKISPCTGDDLSSLRGKIIVVKFGGSAMEESSVKDAVAQQVANLHAAGAKVIVVHGAGNEIGRWAKQAQLKEPTFIAGCRVTDPDTMRITEMVLGGLVNGDITARIARHGVPALGISGRSAQLTEATQVRGPQNEDLGLVGKISKVNSARFHTLLSEGYLPVMPCYSQTSEGQPLNINADHFAAGIAGALSADYCVFLTNVAGVLRDGELISTLSTTETDTLIASQIITGGMIPKVQSACAACIAGAKLSVITDAAAPHSLIRILTGDNGIGTTFVLA